LSTNSELVSRGIGRRLLAELERRAAGQARTIILETGVRNTAAVTLYRNMGYQPTSSYVPGRDPRINRAFTKRLGSPA